MSGESVRFEDVITQLESKRQALEKKEQELLRKQYVADVKRNLAAQLNNIDMVNPDGSVENLGDKYGKKTGLS